MVCKIRSYNVHNIDGILISSMSWINFLLDFWLIPQCVYFLVSNEFVITLKNNDFS